MIHLNNEVFNDSNSNEDNVEEIFHDSDPSDNTPAVNIDGECLNNDFRIPIDQEQGVTGTTFEEDGRMFVQKCHYGEYCYVKYDTYGDVEDTTTRLPHSTDIWSLCDSAPPFVDSPSVKTDLELNSLLEDRRRMVYQSELDNCADVGILTTDIEAAQAPVKPSI